MDLDKIIILIILHWFADFVCQTDEMAINKSKSYKQLLIHSCDYYFVFSIGWLLFGAKPFTLLMLLNWPAHFIIDGISSRITAYLYRKNERHWFFVVIGLDQVCHYVILFLTL